MALLQQAKAASCAVQHGIASSLSRDARNAGEMSATASAGGSASARGHEGPESDSGSAKEAVGSVHLTQAVNHMSVSSLI